MDSLFRERRFSSPEGAPMPLQVMSPNAPSALGAPGPGGENAEGHQGLMPATQVSGTAFHQPEGLDLWTVEASEGNPGKTSTVGFIAGRPGSRARIGSNRDRRSAIPEHDSPFCHGFESIWVNTQRLSGQYRWRYPLLPRSLSKHRPVEGFRWLGEIVHRTTGVARGVSN